MAGLLDIQTDNPLEEEEDLFAVTEEEAALASQVEELIAAGQDPSDIMAGIDAAIEAGEDLSELMARKTEAIVGAPAGKRPRSLTPPYNFTGLTPVTTPNDPQFQEYLEESGTILTAQKEWDALVEKQQKKMEDHLGTTFNSKDPLLPVDERFMAQIGTNTPEKMALIRKQHPDSFMFVIGEDIYGALSAKDARENGFRRLDPSRWEFADAVDNPALLAELGIEAGLTGVLKVGGKLFPKSSLGRLADRIEEVASKGGKDIGKEIREAAAQTIKGRGKSGLYTAGVAGSANMISRKAQEEYLNSVLPEREEAPFVDILKEAGVTAAFGGIFGALWPSLPGYSMSTGTTGAFSKSISDQGRAAQRAAQRQGWSPLWAPSLVDNPILRRAYSISAQFDGVARRNLFSQIEEAVAAIGAPVASEVTEIGRTFKENLRDALDEEADAILEAYKGVDVTSREVANAFDYLFQTYSNHTQQAISQIYDAYPYLTDLGYDTKRVSDAAFENTREIKNDSMVALNQIDPATGQPILNDRGQVLTENITMSELLDEANPTVVIDRLNMAYRLSERLIRLSQDNPLTQGQLREMASVFHNLKYNPETGRHDAASQYFTNLYRSVKGTLRDTSNLSKEDAEIVETLNKMTFDRFSLLEDANVSRMVQSSERMTIEDTEQIVQSIVGKGKSKTIETFQNVEENIQEIFNVLRGLPEELGNNKEVVNIIHNRLQGVSDNNVSKEMLKNHILSNYIYKISRRNMGRELDIGGVDLNDPNYRSTLEAVGITPDEINILQRYANKVANQAPIVKTLEDQATDSAVASILMRQVAKEEGGGNTSVILTEALRLNPELKGTMYNAMVNRLLTETVTKKNVEGVGYVNLPNATLFKTRLDELKESPLFEEVTTEEQRQLLDDFTSYVGVLGQTADDAGTSLVAAEAVANVMKGFKELLKGNPGALANSLGVVANYKAISYLLNSQTINQLFVGTPASISKGQGTKKRVSPKLAPTATASILSDLLLGEDEEIPDEAKVKLPTPSYFDSARRASGIAVSDELTKELYQNIIRALPRDMQGELKAEYKRAIERLIKMGRGQFEAIPYSPTGLEDVYGPDLYKTSPFQSSFQEEALGDILDQARNFTPDSMEETEDGFIYRGGFGEELGDFTPDSMEETEDGFIYRGEY